MDTTLRDAHQSLLATRLRIEDMLPIAAKIDKVGYAAIEMWGGATFDAAIRYLREDPWERLRKLKKVMPKTPFQMLLRGQNLVGYRHYADDVVERFVDRSISNGIDILRIFDALNDLRNLKMAFKATLKYGGKVEGSFCYTLSRFHNNDLFVDLAKRLEDMGSDAICIKDMAGLLSPYAAYDLVSKLKEAVSVPIHLHSHDTSAMAVSTYVKAIEAGVDIIDTAISSMASGTSHPPVETIVNILKGSRYDPNLNMDLLTEISDYFKEVRKKYKAFESDYTGVDPRVLVYQIPGGMTSNLALQLSEQQALDRMTEVLEEVPKVREDFGFPPLVTPSSQIVGTQATLNVLTGERYKVITTETKNYLRGLYGRPSGPINAEIQKKGIGEEELVTCRPADLIEPELEQSRLRLRKENKSAAKSMEDLLTYTLFPKVALDFFAKRDNPNKRAEKVAEKESALADVGTREPAPLIAPSEFNVKVHGETFHVKVGGMGHPGEGGRPYFIYIDGQLEEVLVESQHEVVQSEEGRIASQVGGRSTRPKVTDDRDVTTPMPGSVVAVKVRIGDKVKAGQVVLVIEAMKMQSEVHTAVAGVVEEIYVKEGDRVNPDEVLIQVGSEVSAQ
ncbi:MAG: sodium-extruding oxaloacetate decarboxylase subunit alpha [Nitrospira sp.]|nr:oxaloacetate decarboxylase subunit alpha [Candidatus Manganitrophaceae bacterium]HIL35589.1 oxaloacetate decarboxylase subunit alpha [Candidatus Manganitrophaceae bacterium]